MNVFKTEQIASCFDESPATLKYWAKVGLVVPSAQRPAGTRQGKRYTLRDAVFVKAALELRHRKTAEEDLRKFLQQLHQLTPSTESEVAQSMFYFDGTQMGVLSQSDQVPMAAMIFAWSGEELASKLKAVLQRAPMRTKRRLSARQAFQSGCDALDDNNQLAAEGFFKQAIDKEPRFSSALSNLGLVYFEQGRMGEAKSHFLAALEVEPEHTESRYNLACLFEDVGEIDRAIQELRIVCRQRSDFSDGHFNLARLLLREGSSVQSKAHLERFLELEPCGDDADTARAILSQLRRSTAKQIVN